MKLPRIFRFYPKFYLLVFGFYLLLYVVPFVALYLRTR